MHTLGFNIWNKINPSFNAEELFERVNSQPLRKIPFPRMSPEVPPPPPCTRNTSPTLEWRTSHVIEAASPQTPKLEVFAEINPEVTLEAQGGIARNSSGQRIDPPISYSPTIREALARSKPRMCNVHHLRGNCPFGARCEYNHVSLSEEEKCALQRLAREQPCRKGNECEDAACFAGHHCPRNKGCLDACRFSVKSHPQGRDLHIQDLEVVNGSPDHLRRTSTSNTNTGEVLLRRNDDGKSRASKT